MEQPKNPGIDIYCERCKTESKKPGLKMPFGWLRIDSKDTWQSGSPVRIYYICDKCTRISKDELIAFLKSLKPEIKISRMTMNQPFGSITLNNVKI